MPKDVFKEPDASTMPGYESHPDGQGFFYTADDGKKIAMRGVGPKDRVFRSEKFGLLNVSKALAAIKREKLPPIRTSIDAKLIEHISLVEYDLQYVFEMSEKQSNEPIIMVIASDGANVIDGHHRLKRRIFDKKPWVKAFVLRPETVRYMQVHVFKEADDGNMALQIGMSEEQLDEEIRAGSEMSESIAKKNGF